MKHFLSSSLHRYSRRLRYTSHYNELRNHTMVRKEVFISNLELVKQYESVQGAVVECGTWKGGMIAGMAKILGEDNGRRYFLFDSFEGLPDASAIDGPAALHWQADKTSGTYYDNCKAAVQDAHDAMHIVDITQYQIIKGWFKDTLQTASFESGIAILRLDADWYDSTMEILVHLFKHINPGGLIIIDDYRTWDGCAKAVHAFLASNGCVERIREYRGVSYIVKE